MSTPVDRVFDPAVESAFSDNAHAAAPVLNRQYHPSVEAAFSDSGDTSSKSDEQPSESDSEVGAAETALHYGTGVLASIPAAVAYGAGALGIGPGSLENARAVQNALTFQPRTEQGKGASEAVGKMLGTPGHLIEKGLDWVDPSGQASAAASDVAERTMDILPLAGGPLKLAKVAKGAEIPGNPQSISAAAASALPDSAEGRLADFQRHGIQPMEGQISRDPAQFSAEQNSTNPEIKNRINAQEGQITDALDTIRREAAPDTVHNNPIQNGQIVVDQLKAYDAPIKADISAKYKALIDANGGSVPLDTGSFLTNVDAALKKQYLTSSLPPAAKDLLQSLRDGEPLDFEGYEAARTRLAEAQREGGSSGQAAKIIRNQLEQLPLSPEAQSLKGLADSARSAAAARFKALDADPAYQAAVDDSVKQGTPSPLADKFIDKYVLNAPKANIDTLMPKLGDEGRSAVTSHFLSEIRGSSISPNGAVKPNGYNGMMIKYGPKIDSLVTPDTVDSLESLGRAVTNAMVPPAGHSVNYSKSGVIVNAAKGLASTGADVALNLKTAGAYGTYIKPAINTLTKGAIEKRFTNRALNPEQNMGRLSDLGK